MIDTKAVETLAKYLKPAAGPAVHRALPIVEWAEKYFYIPETGLPIKLLPHQKSLLRFMLEDNHFSTIVYSTVKKSGKTAIASLVARWIAETWPHAEVLIFANDLEQARGRVYAKAMESIELSPGFDKAKNSLPGQWKIIERHAEFIPDGSTMRAVSSDYKGEAGANPSATFWSELWAYTSEASLRLWDELTPVPTRRSIRYVETYAGYEDEQGPLLDLYKLGHEGHRLSHNDLEWPFSDEPPVWINETANICMYWDEGEVARRMPWQTPQYYAEQAQTLRPLAFERLHKNVWTSSTSAFIPIEWWDSCYDEISLDKNTPVVIGVDASVSSDCSALVGVSRHPTKHNEIVVRFSQIWTPPKNGYINLSELEDALKRLCTQYNVVQITYDAYQLHKLMTDLTEQSVAWCKPFSQMNERLKADKQLYDLIRDRKIHHREGPEQRLHVQHCAAQQSKHEDTRMRIVKKTAADKIDYVVALSQATAECLRLLL